MSFKRTADRRDRAGAAAGPPVARTRAAATEGSRRRRRYDPDPEDVSSPRVFSPRPDEPEEPPPRPFLMRKESSKLGVLASLLSPVHNVLNGPGKPRRRRWARLPDIDASG